MKILSKDLEQNIGYTHILHLNIRSLRKHFNELLVMLEEIQHAIDVIILSEININREELSFYRISGYSMYSFTRESTRGGGILIYASNRLSFEAEIVNTEAMETLHGRLKIGTHTTHIIALYRPPSKNKLHFLDQLETIIKNVPAAENLIVIGDTNIDMLYDKMNPVTTRYKNTLCGYGLQNALPSTEITREAIVDGRLDTSCIDHVWVRAGGSASATAFLLETEMSDHHAVGLSLQLCACAAAGTHVNTSDGNSVREVISDKLVRQKFDAYDWTQLLLITCPMLLYHTMCTVFDRIYKESTVRVAVHNKRKTQPWIDKCLYNMLMRRDYLFRVWKASPNSMTKRLEYTRFRNKVNKMVNNAKNKYRQSEIQKCNGDYRKIWANINSWLGRSKNSLDSVILKYMGKKDSMYNICTNFAQTFTREIQNIKHVCDTTFLDRNTYVKQCLVSFRYVKVSPLDVEKIINLLSNEKAPGVDGIRVKDIKYLRNILSPILAKFVNMCMSQSIYPDQLKNAIIRPIYKSGSHLEYANYRPIAILSVIDKIVEKIIVGQISGFLEKHDVLTDTQHGFRRGRSTVTALSGFADHVNDRLNSGEQLVALFIDYKKAFDTLDHDILLQAMEECGIRGPTNCWFRNYLTNRKIRTVINGVAGEEAVVDLGVPTGSVFGPVGYIMHVNSVSSVVKNCRVYMYADDMCLLCASKDIIEVQKCIQEDFENITKWAHDNGILINLSKTKYMHIHSPYNKRAKTIKKGDITLIGHTYECLHNNKMCCNCSKLQLVEKFVYLGLTIDRNFNWKPHVSNVCNRLRSVIGKFFHLTRILNKKTMSVVYYALADSIISYGLSVYGRTFITYINEIKTIQIRLLKFLVSKKTKSLCNKDYEKLFSICKILPVDKKVDYLIGLEYYFSEEYQIKRVNRYNTKSVREGRLKQPKAVNYYGERVSNFFVPKLFNKISLLRKSPKISLKLLKSKLKESFLEDKD